MVFHFVMTKDRKDALASSYQPVPIGRRAHSIMGELDSGEK